MNDFKKMTFAELAEVVVSVWAEVKRRNPIFVNSYETPFAVAVMNLRQIGEAEKDNFTCEAGPGIDKPGKGRKKMDDKTLQRKLNQFVKIGNELVKEAQNRYH